MLWRPVFPNLVTTVWVIEHIQAYKLLNMRDDPHVRGRSILIENFDEERTDPRSLGWVEFFFSWVVLNVDSSTVGTLGKFTQELLDFLMFLAFPFACCISKIEKDGWADDEYDSATYANYPC